MRPQPVPGGFQHLNGVPLGDALLDPARQYRGGALPVERYRLIGGEQRHTEFFQLVFDLGAVEGAAGNTIDGLADDRIEPAIRTTGFGEQILDAAIPGHRDGNTFVRGTETTVFEVFPPGFDVVEVRDDQRAGRQGRPAVVKLPGQRQCRILPILGRSASAPGHAQPVERVIARRAAPHAHLPLLPG
nr:hypothetical protein [Spongiactinospora gelatinilytica]